MLAAAVLVFGLSPSAFADKASPPAPPSQAACDADAKRGDDNAGAGQWAAALASYEKAMKCKVDDRLISKAYLASCNSRNASKAKLYFGKLPADKRNNLRQVCLRNGIDLK
jgi:hypothetical protein